jgi:hypothetical protein
MQGACVFSGTAREDTSWRGRRTENVRFGWFTVLIIKLVTTTRPDENVLFEHWYLEYYVPEDSSAESQSEQYFGALLRLVEITSISAACYGFEERRIVSEGYTASEEVRWTTRLPQHKLFARRHYHHLVTAAYLSIWPSCFWNHSNTATTSFNPEEDDSEESDDD